MTKYINITQGHLDAAIENKPALNPDHTPTRLQAWATTLIDIVTFGRHIMYDPISKAFLVYEIIRKPLYDTTVVQLHSAYCPLAYRGKGIISKLRLEIFSKHSNLHLGAVIMDHKAKDSIEVGKFYANYTPIS